MEALDDMNKSLAWNDKYSKGFLRRANLHMTLGDFEKGRYDFQKVIELDPSNYEAKKGLEDAKKKEKDAKKKDYYKVLELDKTANESQIRKAYKLLALKWHPDKNTQSEAQRDQAERKFKEVNEAYEVLSDPKKKQMFDNGIDPNDQESGGFSHGGNPQDIFNMFFGGSQCQDDGFGGGNPFTGGRSSRGNKGGFKSYTFTYK